MMTLIGSGIAVAISDAILARVGTGREASSLATDFLSRGFQRQQ